MQDFQHDTVQANGITLHYVAAGDGPLVLFCHGFPESWYSWRHQLPVVAGAGYKAVALDMRGYGQSSQPEDIEAYSLSHLVGDVVGAVSALGYDQAIIVGHDWGAPVAWNAALMRPDVFRGVVGLSVPYSPPMVLPDGVRISDLMRANANGRNYYRLYFQQPGKAEAELEADIPRSVLGFLYLSSGDIVAAGLQSQTFDGYFPAGESLVSQFVIPDQLPPWLRQADLGFYIAELSRSGFRGGINWYRNIDKLPAIQSPFVGRKIEQPSLYLYGEHDLIAGNKPKVIAALPRLLPGLTGVVCCAGAGHWLQQERADEVNDALLGFLARLG